MDEHSDYVRRGDYVVAEDSLEQAEDTFQERSRSSRLRDKAMRGPIATDYETWKENQRLMDFPGVDTPTAHPDRAAGDMPLTGDDASNRSPSEEIVAAPQHGSHSVAADVQDVARSWSRSSTMLVDSMRDWARRW